MQKPAGVTFTITWTQCPQRNLDPYHPVSLHISLSWCHNELGECQLLTPKLGSFHVSLEKQAPITLHLRKREYDSPEEPLKETLGKSLHYTGPFLTDLWAKSLSST